VSPGPGVAPPDKEDEMERNAWKAAVALVACFGLASCASAQKKQARSREKDPQYQYNMGLFYLNGNQVDEALVYLNKSLSLSPRSFLAWNAVGLARSMQGNLQESVAAFQKALEINPRFTESRNNLGTIYQEQRFVDKAEAEFRKAIEDPAYPSLELPHYNLARLYFTMDRFDDAYSEVERAIQIRPRFAMAHNLKGLILDRKGDLPGAVDAYGQAARLVPDDANFGFNLGAALYKNDEFERAKEVLERIAPRVTDPETKAKLREYLDAIKGKQ
jgi:Tfp pilus assembly protein PilF